MTNNEYQMLGMTQYMLREFRERCNQHEQEASEKEENIEYPHYADEVVGYPVFNNHACGHQTAGEPVSGNFPEAYYRRWRFFFTPDPAELPHAKQLAVLQEQLSKLKHSYQNRTSPGMVIWILCGLVSFLLLIRDEILLGSIPLMFAAFFWYKRLRDTNLAKQKLAAHARKTEDMHKQHALLVTQLAKLPNATSLEDMHERYQNAIEHLLRDTLLDRLRPHEIGNIDSTLHKHQWEGFITESWGYLQIPLKTQEGSEINQLLLSEDNTALSALQDAPQGRGGFNIYRTQYLHIWILTNQGLLMGRAWYDRVMDYFLYEEHEFYSYTQLTHIRATEQLLPEQATLRNRLPEKLHRRFFRQPLMTISVGTSLGKTYECALPPLNERPFRQTEWLDRYGLDSDITHLSRRLHEHLYKS